MGEREEGFYPSVVSLEGHRGDLVCPFGEPVTLDKGPDSMGAHELGTVQKGKAFLGLESDGFPSHLVPDFLAGTDLPLVKDFSQTNQRKAEVGEGGQVA